MRRMRIIRYRPKDMGQVKVPEILRFPNDDGFLMDLCLWIKRNPQTKICPVQGKEHICNGSATKEIVAASFWHIV